MTKKIKNICIIPARGGSKRIPGKNIKNFKAVNFLFNRCSQEIKII